MSEIFVENQADGRIKYIKYYEDYFTGKNRRVTVTFDRDTKQNRRIAEDTLDARISKVNRKPDSFDTLTLKELSARYMRYQRGRVKVSTFERNERFCDSTCRILGENTLVSRLSPDFVTSRFDGYTDNPGSKNERLKRFKTMWRWAFRQGYIPDDVLADRIEPWKDTPHKAKIQDKYLEKNELKILLNDMDVPLWRDLTEFMALSGLRIGEALALEAADVDLQNRYIHVTKTLNEKHQIVTDPKTFTSFRDVYIQSELLPLVKLLVARAQGGLLFQNASGGYCNYYSFNKYLKSYSKANFGKTITTHALRHTHVSLCAESGLDLETISRRLGHADSRITKEIYLHVTANMKKRDNEKMEAVRILS